MDFDDSDDSSTSAREVGFCTTSLILMNEYYERYVHKSLSIKSSFVGDKWMVEMLNDHPHCFHNIFRMSPHTFINLLALLTTSHDLHGSSRTTLIEVLILTLYMLTQNEFIRATYKRF